jgi:hypothetical protein
VEKGCYPVSGVKISNKMILDNSTQSLKHVLEVGQLGEDNETS